MPLKIEDGERIVFIGDSITDCGRRAAAAPLGEGYVKMFANLVTIREPAKRIDIINKGIGGDNVRGLRDRWSDDVLRHDPDWLSVKIGINDLHIGLRGLSDPIPPELFEEIYDSLLRRTLEARPDCRILLIDPFYISVDRSATSFRPRVLEVLSDYIAVVHELSRRHGTRLVKTHERFQRILETHEADELCPEPVHPYPAEHQAIAEWVYEALSA